ncbi:MAG: hypothetical protein XXXJIFNMEKO3_01175 [Candidatus Erwinia impunctatus]|nr:hypothetical protein XXXJIFNMEKO_01175 [Culicoides impunctatus]
MAINHLIAGFSLPQQREYHLFETALTQQVPKDFNGELYYRISDNLPQVARFTKYDEFGALSLGMPWTFKGMALTVKKDKQMNFIIPENPIVTPDTKCQARCIIIDSASVLSSGQP